MNTLTRNTLLFFSVATLLVATTVHAQDRGSRRPRMPRFSAVELIKKFDDDSNKRLEGAERDAASSTV